MCVCVRARKNWSCIRLRHFVNAKSSIYLLTAIAFFCGYLKTELMRAEEKFPAESRSI